MKKFIIIVSLLCLISGKISVYAEEKEYMPIDKLSRGLYNLLTFPLEIPVSVYKTSVEKNPLIGLTYGFPLGVGRGIIRMFVSLVDITTFPIPPYEPFFKPDILFPGREE